METHILHLVERLDRTAFTPILCCLFPSPEYARRIAALGVRQYDLRTPTFRSPRSLVRLVRFLPILRRHRPRIIHTYGYACDLLGPVLGALNPGTSVITTRRGEDRARRHQRWRSRMNRLTDCILCVSEATASFTRETENLHGARIHVIPNGVIIPEPRISRDPGPAASDHPLRFGTLGTVKPIKGTDILVDAFLRFGETAACELHIGGRTDIGGWGEELVRRARSSSPGHRIHFDGYQADPSGFYAKIDVFVLPSRSEGMSNSLLEAMAFGLPCVVTDVGSNAAVIAPKGETRPGGLVTTPEPEALHRAMRQMLENPAARAEWAAGAYALACRNHSMNAMVASHETVYAELMQR